MALTNLLAQAAPASRPRLVPGELLWAALPLIGILLFGALIIYLFDRWRKRASARRDNTAAPTDQLSHFRSLYERGEMSREEFESVRVLLTGQMRDGVSVAAPPAAASTPAVAEAPAVDTNVQAAPPDPPSLPPAEPPPA
jgi:hypothetical protein